jgi:uncharacterized membrane protein
MTKVLIYGQFAVLGVIFLLVPNMTRRALLFAVPVPAEFRDTHEGRRAIGRFRLAVAIALALGLLGIAALTTVEGSLVMTIALCVATSVAYYKANRFVAPFAVKSDGTRSIELSETPERLPRFVWLAVGPLVLLLAAAVYLNLHWAQIPLRFPVHFGPDGTPNRWAERNIKGVYGPLFFGAELCFWFVICAFAGWFGARRTDLRLSMLEIMIAVEFAMSSIFAAVALLPLLAIPIWILAAFTLCLTIPLAGFAVRKSGKSTGAAEKTPDECWKAGVVYYNPNDPVVFVERRVGFGYTMNFANPWSWALLGGLVVVIASTPLVLA